MNDTRGTGRVRVRGRQFPPTPSDLLGIYLNDHLAGATAAVERAGHIVRTQRGSALARTLEPIGTEIAEDRRSLLEIMGRLDVPVRRYKICAGMAGERLGRLKSNGRLVRRSPLSSMLELEALRLGVDGKAAMWETLRRLPDGTGRLDHRRLDDLLERARRQRNTLEEERRRQAGTVFREG
ncbi:hypothetical protein GCM10018793_27650 [Streptomyces sulfonofaciens]|uniref:Uncharacterized protein n=1 Tax=Streptomyces sulfonofaciens TaxID=68272 RepID=A0A919KZR1_9ACTN|nr:hypothetical protein [Streptomyces sulfonofaciens]GHH78099.1 hypothetical protein GCM10018793_27650 [Streptomyces sulfonofaciens]